MLACAGAAAAEPEPLELAIKATYLYKFAPFVQWPSAASAQPEARLCVVGDDPFGGILERAVAGQRINESPIAVHRLPRAERESGCLIMYVAGSARQPASDALAAVRGTPVLTVTDAARDDAARGIIHFVVADNRIRFEIDNRLAAESGLVISSSLLNLARNVRQRR